MFEDEILSIEEFGSIDTLDIEVSGDHLFYANGILTHNSAKGKNDAVGVEDVGEAYAISQTADWAGAIIQNDELRRMGKY